MFSANEDFESFTRVAAELLLEWPIVFSILAKRAYILDLSLFPTSLTEPLFEILSKTNPLKPNPNSPNLPILPPLITTSNARVKLSLLMQLQRQFSIYTMQSNFVQISRLSCSPFTLVNQQVNLLSLRKYYA